jgi:hypothetical protein
MYPLFVFKVQKEQTSVQQNKVPRTIRNFPRYTPVRDLLTAFNLPYVYDYITKLYRQRREI